MIAFLRWLFGFLREPYTIDELAMYDILEDDE